MNKIGILTCSDKCALGERNDTSGTAIKEAVKGLGNVIKYEITPDDKTRISYILSDWCDISELDLIITTGGTGLGPRDFTPEATREVVERLCPGIPELIRWEAFKSEKRAALSRATAGIRKKTLIINLPGSEKAVKESMETLLPILPHALDILKGNTEHKKE